MSFEKEEKIWWEIYTKKFPREYSEKTLLGQVLATERKAENIFYSVYGIDAVITAKTKFPLISMPYEARLGNKTFLNHRNLIDAKKILRIIDQENDMDFYGEVPFFQISSYKETEKGHIKIPEASFPETYKEYAVRYNRDFNSGSVVKKTKKVPRNLKFKLLIENEKIGFFSKKEDVLKFNEEILGGKGRLK